jgi:Tol biopolymer transport system component
MKKCHIRSRPPPTYDRGPVMSFCGSRVACILPQHDDWGVYCVYANTGRSPRPTDALPWAGGTMTSTVYPAWSPDGDYLAVLTDRTGEWLIWIMEADGGGARPMFDSELDGLRLEYAFAGERAIDWIW